MPFENRSSEDNLTGSREEEVERDTYVAHHNFDEATHSQPIDDSPYFCNDTTDMTTRLAATIQDQINQNTHNMITRGKKPIS